MTNEPSKLVFKFLDAPTGSGKTTAIINRINNATPASDFGCYQRFLVVTPYVTEVDRICEGTACVAPIGKKSADIQQLLANGNHICCTHSLFNLFNEETIDIIHKSGYCYSLIVDEEISVIADIVSCKRKSNPDNPTLLECYSRDDIRLLEDQQHILVDETTKQISWNDNIEYEGIFVDLRERLKTADLFKYGSGVIQLMKRAVWDCFSDITICSYRMQESYLSYYCQLYAITINYQHINNDHEIVDGYLPAKPKNLHLLRLYEEHANKHCTYSKSWYQTNIRQGILSEPAEQLRRDFRSFRRYFAKDGGTDYYWTCYKGFDKSFSDKHLAANRWEPCNLKATNRLSHCCVVGYFINLFANVNIKGFFKSKDIAVNDMELALSNLIQYVWRSNIRTNNNKEVYLFVAAGNLLNDFKDWLTK